MQSDRDHILLPVETYTREFDAKLLLACFLAEAGFRVVLGSRVDMHLHVASLPIGTYLAKDFRRPSRRVYDILRKRGIRIVALDEEGVIYPSREFYYQRRVDETVFNMVDHFFAWGEDSAALLRTCPAYSGQPVTVTGGPRTDLLSTKFSGLFDADADALRNKYGDTILINTNFGRLNHFVSTVNIDPDQAVQAMGDRLDAYQRDSWRYRREILESFKKLLPRLAGDFPNHSIVLRPHPSEDHTLWRNIASPFGNVHVVHQGSVAPWLAAATAIIHNGCMTAVEAFLMSRPVIAYREIYNAELDQKLPNLLSRSAYSYAELRDLVQSRLDAKWDFDPTADQIRVASALFANLGDLASERIAEALLAIATEPARAVGSWSKAQASLKAGVRRAVKTVNAHRSDHKNSKAYSNKRFPPIGLDKVAEKIARFREIEPRFRSVRVRPLRAKIFEIETAA